MTSIERIEQVSELAKKLRNNEISENEYMLSAQNIYNNYFAEALGPHIKLEEPFILDYLETYIEDYRKSVESDPILNVFYLILKKNKLTKSTTTIMPNMFMHRGDNNDKR